MEFLLVALGVFFLVTTAQTFITGPDWLWSTTMVVLSVAGLWLCGDLRYWYGAPAISGIGLLVLRVENLLLVKTDEVLARIRSPRR